MDFLVQASPQLAQGFLITLAMTFGAMLVAGAAAIAAGLARRSSSRVARGLALAYIEVFRGTATLVQLYWLYYALPLIGIVLPAPVVGIGGLGLCIGAYGAEVVSAALAAVRSGQSEAARALGLRPLQILFLVVLPQAFRIMLPQVETLSIELLKTSSLVSLITLHDLTFEAEQLNAETYRTIEIFVITLALYYGTALVMRRGFLALERGLALTPARA